MKVHLVDGSFFPRERSATLAGENSGLGPAHFEWVEGPHPYHHQDGYSDYTFYTDVCLEQAVGAPGRKVAWLLEPPWKQSHYVGAYALKSQFDYILTYWNDCPTGGKGLYYPLGGSWLRDWGIHPKSKLVSIIASEKSEAQGHKLRHEAIARYSPRLDVMGRGYRPIESKTEGLRDYCYSIIIESWHGAGYFSEKLIDCLSQRTIPIYWGCSDVDRFFNADGILNFYDLDELGDILASISKADYVERMDAVRDNLERARRYRCAEDWIFENYPFLFGSE